VILLFISPDILKHKFRKLESNEEWSGGENELGMLWKEAKVNMIKSGELPL